MMRVLLYKYYVVKVSYDDFMITVSLYVDYTIKVSYGKLYGPYVVWGPYDESVVI